MTKKRKMMKTDPIQKYILKNRDNLRIAAMTSESWLAARKGIVQAFQERLKTRLSKKLKGWEFGAYDGVFFETGYAGYYFWKPTWAEQYSLVLQMYASGDQAIFGVLRDKEYIKSRPFSDKLFNAVSSIHPSVERNSWWEARVKMHTPAANWREPKMLWAMHKDKQFLEEVAEQLLEVAEVSTPIIDELVRKYKK